MNSTKPAKNGRRCAPVYGFQPAHELGHQLLEAHQLEAPCARSGRDLAPPAPLARIRALMARKVRSTAMERAFGVSPPILSAQGRHGKPSAGFPQPLRPERGPIQTYGRSEGRGLPLSVPTRVLRTASIKISGSSATHRRATRWWLCRFRFPPPRRPGAPPTAPALYGVDGWAIPI